VESGKISARAMKQSIMTSCRNKIAFGGLSAEDAIEFSREFGKKRVIRRESTFKQQTIVPNILPETYRDTEKEEDRIFYTQLMDGLPRFHFVAKLLKDGTPQPPKLGKGSFVPHDWKERREWEPKRLLWRMPWKRKSVQSLQPELVWGRPTFVSSPKSVVTENDSAFEFEKDLFE